jgi:hypothetical protein
VSYKAGVALAAALEYLVAEITEATGDVATEAGFKRIKPRHLTLSIQSDPHMQEMFKGVHLASGGAIPYIAPELEQKAKGKKKGVRKFLEPQPVEELS